MSWNPGKGCYRMKDLMQMSGYHIIMLQEGTAGRIQPRSWHEDQWSTVLHPQQFFAARRPMDITFEADAETAAVRWCSVSLDLAQPRAG
eukprot:13993769-Alexandrium_andersonii.AAC.1